MATDVAQLSDTCAVCLSAGPCDSCGERRRCVTFNHVDVAGGIVLRLCYLTCWPKFVRLVEDSAR